jgi:hypothetical protein
MPLFDLERTQELQNDLDGAISLFYQKSNYLTAKPICIKAYRFARFIRQNCYFHDHIVAAKYIATIPNVRIKYIYIAIGEYYNIVGSKDVGVQLKLDAVEMLSRAAYLYIHPRKFGK